MIRPVPPSDCAALAEIYNYYILNTCITFEASTKKYQKVPKSNKKYPKIPKYTQKYPKVPKKYLEIP